ncbi:MAG: hemerythrin domain-containing protein [bacterium]
MKRHEKLIPLSREHHKMLLLAQLLKKDAPAYRGMPALLPEKLHYAVHTYKSLIIDHFHREEIYLFPVIKSVSVADELVTELEAEHQQIKSRFDKILNGFVHDKENVHNLALLLESHVRKEERQLFQIVQNELPFHLLDKLNLTRIE